jgi:hypothetical protein
MHSTRLHPMEEEKGKAKKKKGGKDAGFLL